MGLSSQTRCSGKLSNEIMHKHLCRADGRIWHHLALAQRFDTQAGRALSRCAARLGAGQCEAVP